MDITSLGFQKPKEEEYYDINIFNKNTQLANDLIEKNSSAIGQKLVVSASNIPIAERKEGSFYFIITDQQAGGSLENIKVSPTMGLKLI